MWGSTGRGCHLQAVLRAVKLLRAWQGEGDLQHTLALTLRVPKSTPGIRKTGWAHHSLFSLWQNSLFLLNLGIPNILDIYLQVLIPRECRAACRSGKKNSLFFQVCPALSGKSLQQECVHERRNSSGFTSLCYSPATIYVELADFWSSSWSHAWQAPNITGSFSCLWTRWRKLLWLHSPSPTYSLIFTL